MLASVTPQSLLCIYMDRQGAEYTGGIESLEPVGNREFLDMIADRLKTLAYLHRDQPGDIAAAYARLKDLFSEVEIMEIPTFQTTLLSLGMTCKLKYYLNLAKGLLKRR